MNEWREFLLPYLSSNEPVIVCGDLNVAHTEDDIWNPKGNAKMSGFLPKSDSGFPIYWRMVGMMCLEKSMAKASRSTAGGPTEVKQEQRPWLANRLLLTQRGSEYTSYRC